MRCIDAGATRREAQIFEDDSDTESVDGQSIPWEYDAALFDDFDCEVATLSEDSGAEESDDELAKSDVELNLHGLDLNRDGWS